MRRLGNKFFAKKFIAPNGQKFDSRAEYGRWLELKALEERGAITGLRRQVEFELLPKQLTPEGKTLERAANYTADFTYRDNESGAMVAEDTKSKYTRGEPDYILRRKMFRFFHREWEFREVIR